MRRTHSLIAAMAIGLATTACSSETAATGEPVLDLSGSQGVKETLQAFEEYHGEEKARKAGIYLTVLMGQTIDSENVREAFQEKDSQRVQELMAEHRRGLKDRLDNATFAQLQELAEPKVKAHRKRVLADLEPRLETFQKEKEEVERLEGIRAGLTLNEPEVEILEEHSDGVDFSAVDLIATLRNESDVRVSHIDTHIGITQNDGSVVTEELTLSAQGQTVEPQQERLLVGEINPLSDLNSAAHNKDVEEPIRWSIRKVYTPDSGALDVSRYWSESNQQELERIERMIDVYRKI